MPTYAIIIDDGDYVASAPRSTYPNMAEAIRSTAQTALLLASENHSGLIRTDPIECEVQDLDSREVRRFDVAVTTTFHDP